MSVEQDDFTLKVPLSQFVQVGTGDLNAGEVSHPGRFVIQ